jgi:hypothetical protein
MYIPISLFCYSWFRPGTENGGDGWWWLEEGREGFISITSLASGCHSHTLVLKTVKNIY